MSHLVQQSKNRSLCAKILSSQIVRCMFSKPNTVNCPFLSCNFILRLMPSLTILLDESKSFRKCQNSLKCFFCLILTRWEYSLNFSYHVIGICEIEEYTFLLICIVTIYILFSNSLLHTKRFYFLRYSI